jgi:hypothetical protein
LIEFGYLFNVVFGVVGNRLLEDKPALKGSTVAILAGDASLDYGQ